MFRCMGCMAENPQNAPQCPHCGYLRGTPPMEAYHLEPETILQGRYIVGRVLGYGGFGVTYIGWDAMLERIVAIKEFLPSTFATRLPGGTAVTVFDGPATEQFGFGLQRFLDEAQRLAQFNGIPGITDIYDTFAQNNTAYIVMQFLNGQDVKAVLSAKGPMPYEQARGIILKICDTLAPVHETGIIHRDLSPDNIYLTQEGEVKLLDFGAARYESGVNSKSLSVILKPGYAPEEQYRSKGEQGSWTDVYALAATFYKMLTGVTPPDSLERAVRDEIKEPSKLGVQMPQSAENALMNALNIRKGDRTQTVGQFKEALLADGVERVKAKPRKTDTGRLPLGGKIAIAAAVLVLVAGGIALALANSEEDVVIGEAAKLTDTYGNALADGQALVPNLTGMSEAEAIKALDEAGLTLMREGWLPSPALPKNAVAGQQPEAGAVVDEGAAVTVTLSAGTFWEAFDEGLLPQFENLTAPQAVAAFARLESVDHLSYWASYRYENNAAVPAGSVIRYAQPVNTNGSNNYVDVVVSAGEPGGYHLRAPFLYGGCNFMYAAPDTEDWAPTQLQVSPDGAQWYPLLEVSGGYQSDEHAAAGYATYNYGNFQDALADKHPELIGQNLQLRLFWEDADSPQSALFPQTLAVEEMPDADTEIESIQFVTWEELDALHQQGVLNQDNEAVRDMRDMDMDVDEQPYSLYNHPPVVVRGRFTHNSYTIRLKDYDHYSGGSLNNYHNSADENGVKTAALTLGNAGIGWEAQAGRNYDTEVLMYASDFLPGETCSEDGSILTLHMTKPRVLTITPSPALAALLGAPANNPTGQSSANEGAGMEAAAQELAKYLESGLLADESNYGILLELAKMYDVPVEQLVSWLKDNGLPPEELEKLMAWLEAGGYS